MSNPEGRYVLWEGAIFWSKDDESITHHETVRVVVRPTDVDGSHPCVWVEVRHPCTSALTLEPVWIPAVHSEIDAAALEQALVAVLGKK